ncbi:PadR family transcriptional regulator [Clostridium sp. 'deep sea']|uniref:PadR family transcriptional regulator n=1 Tax=Clostridium sp. 'deep sea' TaxID=2779445 RepID=UPI0018966C56|nr:PadR family transcriptional regulator [Clostridium sp. 'deep sea']QOR36268.1 PadR family transcriptional regulator [Clostridium sp. 'deep sea']
MARARKTQYAILGLLNVKPMTGYDIKKYIEQSIGYFWSENYGSIYPTLKKLCEDGLITKKEVNNVSTPNSKIYTITKQGHNTFINWLKKKVDNEKIRDELSLKLFFGSNLSIEENMSRILVEKKEKENLLKSLEQIESVINELMVNNQNKSQQLSYQLMTVLRGKLEINANIEWCTHCLRILKDIKK